MITSTNASTGSLVFGSSIYFSNGIIGSARIDLSGVLTCEKFLDKGGQAHLELAALAKLFLLNLHGTPHHGNLVIEHFEPNGLSVGNIEQVWSPAFEATDHKNKLFFQLSRAPRKAAFISARRA